MKDGKSGYAAPPKPARGEFARLRVVILATRWNVDIVEALIDGARRCLSVWGVDESRIALVHAPGAYEIPLATLALLRSRRCDGVVALGAVIRGDTPHFEYVAGECARGVMDVQLKTRKPVGFGVLTVNTIEQARERAGSGRANKGYEAASAMLEMARLVRALK